MTVHSPFSRITYQKQAKTESAKELRRPVKETHGFRKFSRQQ
jgi:hypothetical protein